MILSVESKTKQKTNILEKRSDSLLPKVGVGEGELDEGGQKSQTSGYKINKYR